MVSIDLFDGVSASVALAQVPSRVSDRSPAYGKVGPRTPLGSSRL
jgi:hypothetical protein